METKIGTIGWMDLTVKDATQIKSFYQNVIGWESTAFSMGDYNDYCMIPQNQESPVCGICHAKGANASLPAQWLIYITVENLETSLKHCKDLGGQQLSDIKSAGNGKYAVIQDPAGAVCALFAENKTS